ncbi:MAG: Fe-S protein assembly co-chaperone HscB [Candidatus Omnitrophica bacterium]|nr:Fe-S protein assembly co-chaperone HscB [Candidatus Omnitrophota bacterium]
MELDSSLLDKTFYELSRKFHPDLFQGKSDKEKRYSLEKTSLLNDAYKTLKNLVARVEYLLDLEVPAPEKERTKVDPALSAEIFEIQEKIEEEKRTKDSALQAELASAKKEVESKMKTRHLSLEAYTKEWDYLENNPAQKKTLAKTIRKTIDEITYLKNLLQSIETGGRVHH